MRIRWTPAAAADLQGISDYLKDHHPRYRDPTMRKLYGTIRGLRERPGRGLPGREEGHPRDFVSSHALRGGVPRERADYRSHADLPRRAGPALRRSTGCRRGVAEAKTQPHGAIL